jgi:oligopeptide/dipeptide ABC transporter ATP-binding protein
VSLLSVEDLRVDYVRGDGGATSALAGVSLTLEDGEVLGLVGESGCGKSTLAGAVMGLLPSEARVSGSIRFEGRQLETLPQRELRRLRGDRLSMIVQDPLSALDPSFSIGSQIADTIQAHRKVSGRAARERATELLSEVGVPGAAGRYRDPPHRFSGGMRQRVVIATAIANDPALLIADEPTTALDATTQAQILALLADLRERHGTAMLLITHDLGVVAQTCHRVGVLYAGQLVELAPVTELFANPRHPYTRTLIAALPRTDTERHSLPVLEGTLPDLSEPPPGCRFAPRCPHAMPECSRLPALAGHEHRVACWLDPASRAASKPAAAPEGALR